MKIEKIETHVRHARMRNSVFVNVFTDQPGLYGWGEATLEWHPFQQEIVERVFHADGSVGDW